MKPKDEKSRLKNDKVFEGFVWNGNLFHFIQ